MVTVNADAVLKGTTVDDLYSGCHPGSGNNSSPGFEHISYREFVSRGYTPMDTTAVAFCEENNIPGLTSHFMCCNYLFVFFVNLLSK